MEICSKVVLSMIQVTVSAGGLFGNIFPVSASSTEMTQERESLVIPHYLKNASFNTYLLI